jgi:hypothetical protein
MHKALVAGTLLAIAAAAWVNAQGQQFPGPGSGIMNVAGTVNIGNRPGVTAAQEGDWKVAIANAPEVRVSNTPTVALAPLPFLKTGTRYEVTWSASEREVIAITTLGGGSWIRVAADGGQRARWLNLALARSVAEAP